MKRQLLAALAGCLALPALGWAQSDGSTIPNAPLYPTARPTRPATLAPARPVSPYNTQPAQPLPAAPPAIVYPSQQAPTLLPVDLAPQASSASFGEPRSSISYKVEPVLQAPTPEIPVGPTPNPVIGAPKPIIGTPSNPPMNPAPSDPKIGT